MQAAADGCKGVKLMRTNNSGSNGYGSKVYVNNYYYNNSSEAFEIYTYDEEEYLSRRKKAKRIKQIKEEERVPVSIFKVITMSVVITVMAVGILSVNAANTRRQGEIVKMREQLEALNENNGYLEAKLNETVDLKRIEELAQSRLGMSKPKSYQIKYINVQRESYTVQYGTEKEDKLTFAKVMDDLFKD